MVINRQKTVFIVFPVHNRITETKAFLASLAQQTVGNYKVVICDDGSTDGTAEYISNNYPDVVLIEGTGDLWWTAGINRCVRYVLSHCNESDYILTLNNDTTLPANYIEQKLERAGQYPNTIIGSLCVYADNRNMIETSGYIMNFAKCRGERLTRPGELRNERHTGVAEVTHLPGKGVLLPVKVFKDIGLYDEANLPQYHADTDLVLRAHKKGYKVLIDFDSIVYSEVNRNIMALPTNKISLQNMLRSFGPHSINNFRVYNNFAVKHFPDNRFKFLLVTYAKTIGGMIKRYLKYKFAGKKPVV
jgi:GT2 family glycosyltransferase